jgi:hypothetical protein
MGPLSDAAAIALAAPLSAVLCFTVNQLFERNTDWA